jgi:mannose-6-phosphate isomerase-like protein (cupin superfamily)
MKLLKKMLEVDDKEMAKFERYSAALGVHFALKPMLVEPAVNIGMEDYPPGVTTNRYGYWHDEIHIVTKGKAEIHCITPTLLKPWKEETFIAEEGDAYVIYRGDQASYKVISKEPYRHLCIIMPAIPFPAEC